MFDNIQGLYKLTSSSVSLNGKLHKTVCFGSIGYEPDSIYNAPIEFTYSTDGKCREMKIFNSIKHTYYSESESESESDSD